MTASSDKLKNIAVSIFAECSRRDPLIVESRIKVMTGLFLRRFLIIIRSFKEKESLSSTAKWSDIPGDVLRNTIWNVNLVSTNSGKHSRINYLLGKTIPNKFNGCWLWIHFSMVTQLKFSAESPQWVCPSWSWKMTLKLKWGKPSGLSTIVGFY